MAEERDAKLATALRQAKQQPMFFAFVPKGTIDGALLVAKKKISTKEVNEAKAEIGGKKVLRGRCVGEDGKLVFELAKEPPGTLAKQLKKVIHESAGMMMGVECRVVADLEEEQDEGDSETPSASAPPTPPSAPPAPPPAPPAPAANPTASRFTARLKALAPIVEKVATVSAAMGAQVKAQIAEGNKAFVAKLYDEANTGLDRAEALIKQGMRAAAPPAAPPPPAADPAARFNGRMKALTPALHIAEKLTTPEAKDVKQAVSEANSFFSKKQYDLANETLDLVEPMLKEALKAGLAASPPPPPPPPGPSSAAPPPAPPVKPKKQLDYEAARDRFLPTINLAAREAPEIGGADVVASRDNMEIAAIAENWDKALALATEAHRKAGLVIQRKPYLVARQAHEPKITAARKIKEIKAGTKVTWGAEVQADWDAINVHANPANARFAEAGAAILALVRKIDTEITPALAEARRANADELRALNARLDTAADAGAKRTIANEIFRNTAAAEALGVDPGENARKPFVDEGGAWSAANCEQTFALYDWFALKKCRKERSITLNGGPLAFTDDDMWKLVQYRGKVVNEELDKLRKKYPTLICKASGSEDIESDIDITIATPRSGDDVKAAQEFNAIIKTRFGKPPGRVFDVNIYPRDYGAIKESFKPDYNVDAIVDENIDEPDQAESLKLSKIDQDVATLIKQRRFLEEGAFNKMLQALIDSVKDEPTKKRIEKQYEEGEDVYLLTGLEKVQKIRAGVKPADLQAKPGDSPLVQGHKAELRNKLARLDAITNTGGGANLAQAQKLIPEILDLFEEAFPAESMDVTDALYLEKMGALRADQETIRSLKDAAGAADKHHPGKTCEQAHGKEEHEKWRVKNLNAVEVKVKKDMFTNIIFANEAIISQGALKHVVEALQARTPEEKLEKLAGLTASDLMQSVNEQVADLFKEMKHYDGVVEEAEAGAGDAPAKAAAKNRANGEGYVHASKYFFRLLDAAISMNLKYPAEPTVQAPYDAVRNAGKLNLQQLKDRVDGVLLKLRKSAVIPPAVKGEVGALELQEIFPQVRDIPTFRTMIENFAIELNKRIRSLDEFKKSQEMDTKAERAAEKAYFEAAGNKA